MNFPQLTFTRFAGAILVVLFHFVTDNRVFQRLGILGPFIHIAPSFVSYFFLLSGFILVIVNDKAVWLQQFPNKLLFWLNRFARIYPMFLFACLLSVPRYQQVNGSLPTTDVLAANILMCQAWILSDRFAINFPDWSLSCEAFLYFLFPFILQKMLLWHTKLIALFTIGSYVATIIIHILLVDQGFGGNFIYSEQWHHNFTFHLPLMHLGTFIVGIGFGIIFVRNYELLIQQGTYWVWGASLGVFLWFYVVFTKQPWLAYHHNGLFVPLYILIITGLCVGKGWLIKLLASKPMVWLGEISYGVYLLQLPVYWLVHLPGLPKIGGLSLASLYLYIPILIAVSGICKFLIEIPANRKIRNLGRRLPTLVAKIQKVSS